jgi:hypothetical protein
MFPEDDQLPADLPTDANDFLTQAVDSIHAPSGAVMLCASAVDAMLKEKGLINGNLYSRINKAAEDGLITSEMKEWAHDVRLNANEQRHADPSRPLPTKDDANRCLDFTKALGEFMFSLPARVARGRSEAT